MHWLHFFGPKQTNVQFSINLLSVDLGAHNKYLTGHAMSKNSIGKIANAHHDHDFSLSWTKWSGVW